jgi:dTDP-4-amino-4,6-dideoxygalactose transaminase
MNVPLVDLKIQYERIKDEVDAEWKRVFANTSYVLGPAVNDFEQEFAAYSSVDHCIGVANGGDALELCLRALDIGHGDEVIVPANTFAATAMAVLQAGATPVAVDVDEHHHLIDPSLIESAITERTKAIIPVHLFGQLAPMEEIINIARRHDLRVIEDAAQCQGATQYGKHAGQFGDMAATSFYPGKNLGAFGDGGAVLTRDNDLATRVRRLRNYGGIAKYEHIESGRNSRLDSLQAAVLSVKLRHLDAWNDERRAVATTYLDSLAGLPTIQLPAVLDGNEHVWHLFVIKVADRDEVLTQLNEAGVGAGIHYPSTVNSLATVPMGTPVAEHQARAMISLPIFPGMTNDAVMTVIEKVRIISTTA